MGGGTREDTFSAGLGGMVMGYKRVRGRWTGPLSIESHMVDVSVWNRRWGAGSQVWGERGGEAMRRRGAQKVGLDSVMYRLTTHPDPFPPSHMHTCTHPHEYPTHWQWANRQWAHPDVSCTAYSQVMHLPPKKPSPLLPLTTNIPHTRERCRSGSTL